jgi:hypothetical protein
MFAATNRCWLSSVLCSSPSRVRSARLRLENLEGRDVPSIYYWFGSDTDKKWSTLTNWKLIFSADPLAAGATPDSTMDAAFQVASLNVEPRAAPYKITLNGELRIDCMSTEPTVVNPGNTGGLYGAQPVTFAPVEGGEFDWLSGQIVATVTVPGNMIFHIKTDATDQGGTKELAGQIWDYSVNSDWDGKGQFKLSASGVGTAFTVLGSFGVTANKNATIDNAAGAKFENQGTVTTDFPLAQELSFGVGTVNNYGNWRVVSGGVSATYIQNSGVIQLDSGTFTLGQGDGWAWLDPEHSPTGQSIIRGPGSAVFNGSVVTYPGTSQVQNVQDNSTGLGGLRACWENPYLCVFASRRAMMPMRATWTTARLLARVCS